MSCFCSEGQICAGQYCKARHNITKLVFHTILIKFEYELWWWDWQRDWRFAHARLYALGENLFLVNFPNEDRKKGGGKKNQWMLFSQRHKKKCTSFLQHLPRRRLRSTGNDFSRESKAVFCALKWWVASKVQTLLREQPRLEFHIPDLLLCRETY